MILNEISKWKNTVGLSLVVTCGYFFFGNSFIFKPIHFLLYETLVLLTFCLFSLFVFTRILKFFEKNYDFKIIIKVILIFFFCWLLTQTLKNFFYLANANSLSQFIFIILGLESESKKLLSSRLIIFLSPYILFFIFTLVARNNLVKIMKFLTIVGYIFFVIVSYNVIQRSLIYLNVFEKNELATVENKQVKNKKLIWITFDSFDPNIAFSNQYLKDNTFLKNFNNFKNESFYHSNIYPPAKFTILAMPSMLLGKQPTGENVYKDRKAFINSNNELFEFNYENSIFKDLNDIGINSSLMSNVLPYCRFVKLDNCISTVTNEFTLENVKLKLFGGITFVFNFFSKIDRFFLLLNKQDEIIAKVENSEDPYHKNYKLLNNLNEIINHNYNNKINSINYLDVRKCCKDVLFYNDVSKNIISDENQFVFLHLLIPHPNNPDDEDFAQKVFEVKTRNDGQSENINSYIVSLKLADQLLGKILKEIENLEFDDLMVILSSDHWYRLKDKNTRKSYNSLFIAKIYGDETYFEAKNPSSAVYIHDLILNFFNDEINNHESIFNYFKNKKFLKTYMKG
tara:strand:+ start:2385 stop:4091 length:1707 start_codon:yes stop_codon:yes gene_type:complete